MLITRVLLFIIIDSFVTVLLDMHVQIAGLSKTFSTILTDIRFLSGVRVNVNLELERQSKQRMAVGTLELLLRWDAFPFNSLLGV